MTNTESVMILKCQEFVTDKILLQSTPRTLKSFEMKTRISRVLIELRLMMLLLFIVDNGSVYDLFEQTPSIDIISIY